MRMHVAALILVVVAAPAAAADITGRGRVMGGGSVKGGGERVRLHDIDAPEARQTCPPVAA